MTLTYMHILTYIHTYTDLYTYTVHRLTQGC